MAVEPFVHIFVIALDTQIERNPNEVLHIY
jgi:hypothetical protein